MNYILLFFTLVNILSFTFLFPQNGKGKAGIVKEVFGTMPDGREAHLFTLRNAAGMEVKISNYGGYIVS